MNNSASSQNESASNYSKDVEGVIGLSTFGIIHCVLNASLMLISIIGNTLVLAAILRTPSLHSPSVILLCSLAISDLLVGLVAQPIDIVHELTKDLNVLRVAEIVAYALCGISLTTMTLISLDRFAALHYHMRYAVLVTVPRVLYTLIISSCLILVFVLALHLSNTDFFLFGMSAAVCVCLSVSLFSYIKIFRIVQRHQLQIHVQQQAVQISHDTRSSISIMRLRKSAINTLIFYIVIILCYCPKLMSLILYTTSKRQWVYEWNFTDTVVYMNSSINPFLYCWRLRELRTAVLNTMRWILCKQTSRN